MYSHQDVIESSVWLEQSKVNRYFLVSVKYETACRKNDFLKVDWQKEQGCEDHAHIDQRDIYNHSKNDKISALKIFTKANDWVSQAIVCVQSVYTLFYDNWSQ